MDPQAEPEIQQEQQEGEIQKQLVFKSYPSIQLWTRDKIVKALREAGFDKENILWVASEKIHGSNYSIHCTNQIVKYGRRTDFLTKDIPIKCENPGEYFLETFYDARNYVSKIHNNLLNVYNDIKEVYPEMIKFSVYGEYFGGNWPGNNKGPKPVQRGIFYSPNHQFMAFDIKVYTQKSVFWVDVLDIPKLLKDNIKSIPVYQKGTFDQVFQINTKIDSTIPGLLGFQKQDKNIIEGMVLRPNSNLKLPKGSERVILKKKNPEFDEFVVKQPKQKKEVKEVKVSPDVAPYLQELQNYINPNRVESLMSKFPDEKNRKKLLDELVKDIVTDAEKDEFKWPEEQQINKQVKNQLSKKAMKAINDYFIKH